MGADSGAIAPAAWNPVADAFAADGFAGTFVPICRDLFLALACCGCFCWCGCCVASCRAECAIFVAVIVLGLFSVEILAAVALFGGTDLGSALARRRCRAAWWCVWSCWRRRCVGMLPYCHCRAFAPHSSPPWHVCRCNGRGFRGHPQFERSPERSSMHWLCATVRISQGVIHDTPATLTLRPQHPFRLWRRARM